MDRQDRHDRPANPAGRDLAQPRQRLHHWFQAQPCRVSGPDLSIDDVDAIKVDAREKAIADAKAQAEVLAEQLGVRLGKIVSFSESGNENYPMYMSARADVAMSGKAAPEANIATGEQTITSNVSITYKIR